MASRTYFRKSVKDIYCGGSGLCWLDFQKLPVVFLPVFNPDRAKSRQIYVLNRMRQEGYITEANMEKYLNEDIKVFVRKDFSAESPYYLETVRRLLLQYVEEIDFLEKGLKIYTVMDLEKQKQAQKALKKGLEAWDKRKGFRGVIKNMADLDEQKAFMKKTAEELRSQIKTDLTVPGFILSLDEETEDIPPGFFCGI